LPQEEHLKIARNSVKLIVNFVLIISGQGRRKRVATFHHLQSGAQKLLDSRVMLSRGMVVMVMTFPEICNITVCVTPQSLSLMILSKNIQYHYVEHSIF